ncbi:MAG: hypothetical protein Rubg2KO_01170 [Rubricoccaceae bacterium]
MPDSQPNASTPISRRESLKRAAGALALGLGAPAVALAETGAAPAQKSVITFHKGRELVAEVAIPTEIAELLRQPDAFGTCKIPAPPAPMVTFEVRRLNSRERRG